MGRPKSEASRDRVVIVRMTKEEKQNLEYLKVVTGKNLSEIVREALDIYENEVEKRVMG